MTREEAIKVINKYFPSTSCGEYKELIEALKMAIEALSTDEIAKERQEIYKLAFTDGYKKAMYVVYECAERDLISKAEVHKVLSLLSTEGGKDAKALFMDAHEWVDGLPSVSEKHQLSEETSTMGVDISTNTPTDLISRADAIEQIKEWAFGQEFKYTNATEYLLKRIASIPSAGRPTGEWVESLERNNMMHWYSYGGYCTHCGEYSEYLTTYCGDCGAVMYALNDSDEVIGGAK